MAAFVYGRKSSLGKPVIIGIALMAFPYFVSATWVLFAVGCVLPGALFVLREQTGPSVKHGNNTGAWERAGKTAAGSAQRNTSAIAPCLDGKVKCVAGRQLSGSERVKVPWLQALRVPAALCVRCSRLTLTCHLPVACALRAACGSLPPALPRLRLLRRARGAAATS